MINIIDYKLNNLKKKSKCTKSQCQDIYYISANSEGNSTSNARAKLADRWKNVLFDLRSNGVLPPVRRSEKTDEDVSTIGNNKLLIHAYLNNILMKLSQKLKISMTPKIKSCYTYKKLLFYLY